MQRHATLVPELRTLRALPGKAVVDGGGGLRDVLEQADLRERLPDLERVLPLLQGAGELLLRLRQLPGPGAAPWPGEAERGVHRFRVRGTRARRATEAER